MAQPTCLSWEHSSLTFLPSWNTLVCPSQTPVLTRNRQHNSPVAPFMCQPNLPGVVQEYYGTSVTCSQKRVWVLNMGGWGLDCTVGLISPSCLTSGKGAEVQQCHTNFLFLVPTVNISVDKLSCELLFSREKVVCLLRMV